MTSPNPSDDDGTASARRLDIRSSMAASLARRGAAYGAVEQARADLAAQTRRLIDALLAAVPGEDELRVAAELVTRAADAVSAAGHERPYREAESSLVDARPAPGAPAGAFERSAPGPRAVTFLDNSPFSGPLNPLSIPFDLRIEEDRIVAVARFGSAYEGPPGCVHGGYIAAVFDEVLGFAQSLSGQPGMTGRLAIDYRSPTPLHRDLRIEAWIERVEGRKLFARGTLHVGDRLCAEAAGLFVSMRPEVFARLLANRPVVPDG